MVSAKNLPSMPVECVAKARMPGSGPKPTAATQITPQIRPGIERSTLRKSRTGPPIQVCATILRAASAPSGKATATASAVPATLMDSVSNKGRPHSRQRLKSGGMASAASCRMVGSASA